MDMDVDEEEVSNVTVGVETKEQEENEAPIAKNNDDADTEVETEEEEEENKAPDVDPVVRLLEEVTTEETPFDTEHPSFSAAIDETESRIEETTSRLAVNNDKGNQLRRFTELRIEGEEERKKLQDKYKLLDDEVRQTEKLLQEMKAFTGKEKKKKWDIGRVSQQLNEMRKNAAAVGDRLDELEEALSTPQFQIDSALLNLIEEAATLKAVLATEKKQLSVEMKEYLTNAELFLKQYTFVVVFKKKCYKKKYPIDLKQITDFQQIVAECNQLETLLTEHRAQHIVYRRWINDIPDHSSHMNYELLLERLPIVKHWQRWESTVIAFLLKNRTKLNKKRSKLGETYAKTNIRHNENATFTQKGWYLHHYTNNPEADPYSFTQKPFIHTVKDNAKIQEFYMQMKKRMAHDEALTTFDDVIDLTTRPDLCFIRVSVSTDVAPEMCYWFKFVLAETKKRIEVSAEEFISYLRSKWNAVTKNVIPFPFHEITCKLMEERIQVTSIPNKAVKIEEDGKTAVAFACQGLAGHTFQLNNEKIISGIRITLYGVDCPVDFGTLDNFCRRVSHARIPSWEQECKILSINNGLRLERTIDILDVDTYVNWSRHSPDKSGLFQFFGAVALTRCVGCDQLLWFWHNAREVLYDQYFCSGASACLIFPDNTEGRSAVVLFPPDLVDFYIQQLFNGRKLGFEQALNPGGEIIAANRVTDALVFSTEIQLNEASVSIKNAVDFVDGIERAGLPIKLKPDSYQRFADGNDAFKKRVKLALKHCTRDDGIHWELYKSSEAVKTLHENGERDFEANVRVLDKTTYIARDALNTEITSRFNVVLRKCITFFLTYVTALQGKTIVYDSEATKLRNTLDIILELLQNLSYVTGSTTSSAYAIVGAVDAEDNFVFKSITASVLPGGTTEKKDAWTYLKELLQTAKSQFEAIVTRVGEISKAVKQRVPTAYLENQLAIEGTYRPLNSSVTERTHFKNRIAGLNRFNVLVRMFSYSMFWNLFTNSSEMNAQIFETLCDKVEAVEADLTQVLSGKALNQDDADSPQHWDLTEIKSIMQGRSKFIQAFKNAAVVSSVRAGAQEMSQRFHELVERYSRYPELSKETEHVLAIASFFGEMIPWERDFFARFCSLLSYSFMQSPQGAEKLVGISAWKAIPAEERDQLAVVDFEEKGDEKDPTAVLHVVDFFVAKTTAFINHVTDETRPDPCVFDEIELEHVVQYCASEQRVVDSFKELFADPTISDESLLGIQNKLRTKAHLFKQRGDDEISSFLNAIVESKDAQNRGTAGPKRKRVPKAPPNPKAEMDVDGEETESEDDGTEKKTKQAQPEAIVEVKMKDEVKSETKAYRSVLPCLPDATASAEEVKNILFLCDGTKQWNIENNIQGSISKINSRGLEIELTQKLRRLFTSTATAVEEWMLDEKAMVMEPRSMLHHVTGISKQKQEAITIANPGKLVLPMDPNLIPWRIATKTNVAMYMLDLMGVRRLQRKTFKVKANGTETEHVTYNITDMFAYMAPPVDPNNAVYSEFGYPYTYRPNLEIREKKTMLKVEPWDNSVYRQLKRRTKPREFMDIPVDQKEFQASCQRCNQPLDGDDIKSCHTNHSHRGIHRECCNEEDFALFQSKQGPGCPICIAKQQVKEAACCMCNQQVAHLTVDKDNKPLESDYERKDKCKTEHCVLTTEHDKILRCCLCRFWYHPTLHFTKNYRFQSYTEDCLKRDATTHSWSCARCSVYEEFTGKYDPKMDHSIKCVACYRLFWTEAFYNGLSNCTHEKEEKAKLEKELARVRVEMRSEVDHMKATKAELAVLLAKLDNTQARDAQTAVLVERQQKLRASNTKLRQEEESLVRAIDTIDKNCLFTATCALTHTEWTRDEASSKLKHITRTINNLQSWRCGRCLPPSVGRLIWNKEVLFSCPTRYGRNYELLYSESEAHALHVKTSRHLADKARRALGVLYDSEKLFKLTPLRDRNSSAQSKFVDSLGKVEGSKTEVKEFTQVARQICKDFDKWTKSKLHTVGPQRYESLFAYSQELDECIDIIEKHRRKPRKVSSVIGKKTAAQEEKERKMKEDEKTEEEEIVKFKATLQDIQARLETESNKRKKTDEKVNIGLLDELFNDEEDKKAEEEDEVAEAKRYKLVYSRKEQKQKQTKAISEKKAMLRMNGVYFNPLKSLFFDIPIEIVSELRADILHQSWRTRSTKGFPSLLALLPPRQLPVAPLNDYMSHFTFYTPDDMKLVAKLETKDALEDFTFIHQNMIDAAIERGRFSLNYISESIDITFYFRFQVLTRYGLSYGIYKQWECLKDGTFTEPPYTPADKANKKRISLETDVRATPTHEYKGMFNQPFIDAVVTKVMLHPLSSIIKWAEKYERIVKSDAVDEEVRNPEADSLVQKRNMEKLCQVMNCKSTVPYPAPSSRATFFSS